MEDFKDLNLNKALLRALEDMGLERPTPIQAKAFSVVRSGKNVIGISQTGTGKTLAYILPILQDLPFSDQIHPRVLVMVPTRELVLQVVEQIKEVSEYINLHVVGVYGGTNINTQALAVAQGVDVLIATPGRLYDLALNGALKLKSIKKLVIDEVDVMLDLGFRFQLTNIFELLPESRQNIMFSATMTEEIEDLIEDFFIAPVKISIAVSGTPLDNISQVAYAVPNFLTKVNLLIHLLSEEEVFEKVLVFVSSKAHADRLYDSLAPAFRKTMGIIHSNKSQNQRIAAVEAFDNGENRIIISTDIMARGIDLQAISHVVNFDTPSFPENYMHRIGRTGRAERIGASLLFHTEAESEAKAAIEQLMDYEIPAVPMPEEVEINPQLIPEERKSNVKHKNPNRNVNSSEVGPSFHERKDKNKKVNLGGSYHREIAIKYKKPKTRGDKRLNNRKKK